MKNHKFSRIIRTIYPNELKDFEIWFRGKTKGKETHAWRLWGLAKKKGVNQWEDERVWKRLFPGSSFKKERYNREISNIFRPLMKYLPFIQLKREPHTWKLLLLRLVNKKSLFQEFDWLWKKYFVPLKKTKQKTTYDFHLIYQAELEKHNRLQQNSLKKRKSNLPEAFKSFQTYWMLEFLQMACYSLSHNQIRGEEISTQDFDSVIELIDQDDSIIKQPLYQVFRSLYDALADRGNKVKIVEKMKHYQTDLSQADSVRVFALIFNFFTKKINTGHRDPIFFEDLIDLYQWGFDQKLLHYPNQKLRPGHYNNLISICNRIEKYELAKTYIETWQHELPEETRQETHDLNLAHYYFYTEQYSQTRRIISQTKRQDVKTEVRLKFLELRIVYEELFAPFTPIDKVRDPSELKTQIKALLRFIRTQKGLSNLHKDPYSSRLKLFLKLLTAKTENSLHKLRNKLSDDHSIDYVRWLLEKTNQRLKNEYGFTE